MSKKNIYICENEYGEDPCEWALEAKKITEADLPSSSADPPKCTGITRSGKECGHELVKISGGSGGNMGGTFPKAVIIAALIIVAGLGSWGGWRLLNHLFNRGTPVIEVETSTITFPETEAGGATASLRIHNKGDDDLEINRIELSPSEFSSAENKVTIAPEGGETLILEFKSGSDQMVQGQLLIHHNSEPSPVTVKLIANHDPWWVYKELETSSKILKTRQ